MWTHDFSPEFGLNYGMGAGLGLVFGPLLRNQAYRAANGDYEECTGPGVPNVADYCGNDNDHYNDYEEPSWADGGSKPIVFPWFAAQPASATSRTVTSWRGSTRASGSAASSSVSEATTGSERASSPGELDLPGRYEPLARLGKGGGGEVWAVRDRHSGARYALKTLDPSASEREMEALVREAAALSGLEGLGVPRVIRFGRLPRTRRPFLVRELVEGSSLEQWISDGARLREALVALVSAVEQLTVLHRAGLLHGDVKPANIIVRGDGSGTFVDLGLAAPLREGGSSAAGLTPHFAAPELLQGGALTVRAEVYALGVTLDEALKQARTTELSQSSARDLEAVARRARALSPAERFPSVDELASAIRRAASLPGATEDEEHVALWPIVGIDSISGQLLEATRALPSGGVLSITGAPGSGRTALLRRLGWSLGVEGQPVAIIESGASGAAAAHELEVYASLDGVFVLVDDADQLSPDAVRILKNALGEKARLVGVGAATLRTPTREVLVPPIQEHALRELVRRAIPSSARLSSSVCSSSRAGVPASCSGWCVWSLTRPWPPRATSSGWYPAPALPRSCRQIRWRARRISSIAVATTTRGWRSTRCRPSAPRACRSRSPTRGSSSGSAASLRRCRASRR